MRRILLILFIYNLSSYAQIEVLKSSPTVYPYGGQQNLERFDKRLQSYPPLDFNKSILFLNGVFDSLIYFHQAHFNNNLRIINSSFIQPTNFYDAKFYGSVSFLKNDFRNNVSFENSRFFGNFDFIDCTSLGSISFNNTIFDSVSSFQNSEFHSTVSFYNTKAYDMFDFSSTNCKKQLDFRGSIFHDVVYFEESIFNNKFYISNSVIEGNAFFNGCKFKGIANFFNTTFKGDVSFSESDFTSGAIFGTAVNFEKVKFLKTADFRSSNFESVRKIYLYGTKFSPGQLFVYWDQLKAEDSLRISLSDFSSPKDSIEVKNRLEQYRRIETIYLQLRDNFLNQDNKSSADEVMFELGSQRSIILNELSWTLYGWFFGWGYKPWRFILFTVFPIILLFSIIWYFPFYHLILPIVWVDFPSNYRHSFSGDSHKKDIRLSKNKNIVIFNHSSIPIGDISYLSRIWHVIHFSTSVLLGIRFKKEWISTTNKWFLYCITIEWVIGIIFYITFAILVKGVRFGFIKDIFGF